MLELRRRIQADPASIAFAQLAEECRRIGSNEEAAEICRVGLVRHPGYLSARVTLGRALIELGQLDEAKTELEIVVAGVPDNLAAIRGLAEILQRRGQMAEALQYYKRALELARHDPDLEDTVERISQAVAPAPAPQVSGPQVSIEEIFNFDTLITQLGLPPEEPGPLASAFASAAEGRLGETSSASAADGGFGVTAPKLVEEPPASEGGPKLVEEFPTSGGGPAPAEPAIEDFFADTPSASVASEGGPVPSWEELFAEPIAEPSIQDQVSPPPEASGPGGPMMLEQAAPFEDFLALESPASAGGPVMLAEEATVEDFFAEIASEPAEELVILSSGGAELSFGGEETSAYAAEGGFGATAPELANETVASGGGPLMLVEEPSTSEGVEDAPLEEEAAVEDFFAEGAPEPIPEDPIPAIEASAPETPTSEGGPDDADSLAVLERELRELEQQRAADERRARVELSQRRRAAMVIALETWLSAIVADREQHTH